MKRPTRILVVRTDRLGDVVLATPLIRALRLSFPGAFIAAMVRPYAEAVLHHNPHLDKILVDDPEGDHYGRKGFWNQVRTLRQHKIDTALLLLPTERLTWMLFFAGIRTRVTVGLRLNQVLTLMKTVSRRKYIPLRHEADYCLDLGRAIGAKDYGLDTEVFITTNEKLEARSRIGRTIEEPIKTIGVHPGSGRSAPNWPVGYYVELVKRLLKIKNTRIVITGSNTERDFELHFKSIGSNRVLSLIGALNTRELMGVISCFDLLVSASTGPMHIAAALQIPTVSMFCPLPACSPFLWGPKGNIARVVLPHEDYCQKSCPGDPHVCDFTGGITVERVEEVVKEILG